jgi:hypothetical protein
MKNFHKFKKRTSMKFLTKPKAAVFVLLISLSSYGQEEINGVNIPKSKTNEVNTELQINGAGTREKLWMDLYVASLYVENQGESAESYYNSDQQIAIHIETTSSLITAEKMSGAIEDGFEKSVKNPSSDLSEKLDSFTKLLLQGEVESGTTYTFSYAEDTTYIYIDGEEISQVKGQDFKAALFGIWLCEKPADKNLKKAFLKGEL